MKTLLTICITICLVTSAYAGGHGGSGGHSTSFGHGYGTNYNSHGCYNGWGGNRSYGNWGSHYWHGQGDWYGHGYGWGSPAAFWTGFGLTAGAIALGAYDYGYQYPYTYNIPQVVYQPAPQVTYVQQPEPQIVYQPAIQQSVQQYVQQPQVIVQQVHDGPPAYPMIETPQQDKTKNDSSNTASNGIVNIYLPNGNGTFTVVPLIRTATGFMGPMGEFYVDHPDVNDLQKKYVKNK